MTRCCRILVLLLGVLGPTLPGPARAVQAQQDDRGQRAEDRDRDGQRRRRRGRRWQRDRRSEDRRSDASSERPADEDRTAYAELSATDKARAWASEQIAKHDQDGDKMLQPAEQKELGASKRADANADGTITKDELVDFSLGRSKPAAASTAASRPAVRARQAERDDGQPSNAHRVVTGSNGERKSYRFTPPAERLPDGLPGYFRRDANGDGQVAMHEFANSWNERTAREFIRHDKNNDGIITAEEALAE